MGSPAGRQGQYRRVHGDFVGDDRDNQALAARNALTSMPSWVSYLRDTGATVDEFSAGDYPGQVDVMGIHLLTS